MSNYRKFLLDIANNLVTDDIANIKFILKGKDVGSADLQAIENGKDVLDLLEKRSHLTHNNLTYLQEILEKSGCRELAVKVKDQCKFITQTKAVPYHGQEIFVVSYFQETKSARDLSRIMESKNMSVLVGPVGCGKSQLSYWYAKKCKEKNKDGLVWKFQCRTLEHLSRSMKTLLEYLDIDFFEFVQEKEMYILMMGDLVCSSFLNTHRENSHLLIFDDVQKSCLQVFKKLLNHLSQLENLKIILTSNNSHIDQEIEKLEDCSIRMNGMSEEEAVTFFRTSRYFVDAQEEDIKILSRKLGHLPLGLFTARSYIQRTHISISKYVKHLEEDDFLKNFDVMHPKDGEYDKGLMASQLIVLEEIKLLLPPVAYKFFYYVPFLDYENIPISLFYNLLPPNLSDAAKTVLVGAFVTGLGEYSLGEVRGIDDNRVISFHAATKLAMSLLPNFKEHCEEIIMTLVRKFTSHIDMDGRQCTTLTSNLLLLEHASKVLEKVEAYLEQTDEIMILTSYLCCTLGVTYRLQGCDDFMAHQFLTKAMQICLKLIGKDKNFLNEINVQTRYPEANVVIDKNIRMLYDDLVKKGMSIPLKFYQEFMEEKIRSERDIEHMMHRGKMQREDFTNCKISHSCHEKLVDKELAMSDELLQRFFLVELFMSISYNSGRHLYRMKHSHHKSKPEILEDCCRFFCLSFQLSNLMKMNCGKYLPVQSLIAERNGSLYFLIRDAHSRLTPDESIMSLKKAVERYEVMLKDKQDYFEFGILKMGPEFNQHHIGMCYKLLLKCYSRLYNLLNGDNKEQAFRLGLNCVKELEKLENQLNNWIALAGFHIQIAKFYKLRSTIYNLECAIAHSLKAIELEKRDQEGVLSHFMLQAKLNLIESYLELDSVDSLESAFTICQELVRHLESKNRDESLKKATNLLEKINQRRNPDVEMR